MESRPDPGGEEPERRLAACSAPETRRDLGGAGFYTGREKETPQTEGGPAAKTTGAAGGPAAKRTAIPQTLISPRNIYFSY